MRQNIQQNMQQNEQQNERGNNAPNANAQNMRQNASTHNADNAPNAQNNSVDNTTHNTNAEHNNLEQRSDHNQRPISRYTSSAVQSAINYTANGAKFLLAALHTVGALTTAFILSSLSDKKNSYNYRYCQHHQDEYEKNRHSAVAKFVTQNPVGKGLSAIIGVVTLLALAQKMPLAQQKMPLAQKVHVNKTALGAALPTI